VLTSGQSGAFGSDLIFVTEFLKAGRKWAPNFADNWLLVHEATSQEDEFFKTTRSFRSAYQAESIKSHALKEIEKKKRMILTRLRRISEQHLEN
jgi:hypothetical protein